MTLGAGIHRCWRESLLQGQVLVVVPAWRGAASWSAPDRRSVIAVPTASAMALVSALGGFARYAQYCASGMFGVNIDMVLRGLFGGDDQ